MSSNPFQSASQIPDFRGLPPNQLDTFIAQHLQPDEQFHSLVSSALDVLCRYLQDKLRPNVKRLVKSGSMGKGTALKNTSDLDCVLIMNNITDAVQLRAEISGILSQIRSCLGNQPLQGWRITITKVNEYMLQFDMTKNGKAANVDLLPTFDGNVTDAQARLNLHHKMASFDEATRSYCSAALAEIQKDFIVTRPAKLKDLIRLVKHWAKTYLPISSSTLRFPSYLIELVVIHFWEKAGSPNRLNTADLFKTIMEAFCDHTRLNISWNRYYTLSKAASHPGILDPANPYNDLYTQVNGWATVAKVARETLQKQGRSGNTRPANTGFF